MYLGTYKYYIMASQVAEWLKSPPANSGDSCSILGSGRFPGDLATNSSILAWKIPWTKEPGRLHSMQS